MGFDIECIPNIQSLPWEYFCPVCGFLVYPNEALQSMCTHLYCKPCLAYVTSTTRACPYDGYLVTETDAKPLVESNKVLADTIGRVVVQCLYHLSGCTWMGSLSESSSHCSRCAFGSSPVICNMCGIQFAYCHVPDHAHVCPGVRQAQVQASIQASAQGEGVAAATMTQEQWYQQQHYLNYYGYDMYQQQVPMSYPQQQVYPPPGQALQTNSQYPTPYVQPPVQQSQPHLHDPSQISPASQGIQNPRALEHSQSTPLSVAHHLQNTQVPQQFRSQLHIQNPASLQANTVQNSLLQNNTGQGQSHQPHAYLPGQKMYPQPNLTNNMAMYHNVCPPLALSVMQKQQPSLPSILRSIESARQLVRKYGGVSGQASPSLPAVKQTDMQRTQNQVPLHSTVAKQGDEAVLNGTKGRLRSDSTNIVNGVKHVEITATKFDPELKRKHTDACQRSSTIVECSETKSGPLGKQVIEENDGNVLLNPGNSHVVGEKCTENHLSLNGAPVKVDKSGKLVGTLNKKKELEGHNNHDVLKGGEPSLPRLKEGDGGSSPIKGDVRPFPDSGKRAREDGIWCRICEVDCVTLEGLYLHFHDKEHRQKAKEVVSVIRQNAKKLKIGLANANWEDLYGMMKSTP